MDQYEKVTSDIATTLNTDAFKNDPLYPYLSHELLQTQELLSNLKPKIEKRSLNFIGTAWKWVAGNPDHEDFLTIQDKMNSVLKNNNQQVIINKSLTDRLNNLTLISNKIEKFVQTNENFRNEHLSSLQYKLKLIKEELINIKYAISFAKIGTINTLMLSQKEIKLATQILDKEKLPYASPEEALEFSNVKIITNHSSLLYIVNIPITTEQTYEKIRIKPVKNKNVIVEIPQDFVLKNQNQIYSISEKCKTFNNLAICNQIYVNDISNSSCISKILQSLNSHCNKISNQHIPTIEQIAPDMILVNDFKGTLNIDQTNRELNGTFVIKFSNVTITINNRSFSSQEVTSIEALPAILQPTPREQQYREILSLEMMKELSIQNTDEIRLLEAENKRDKWTNYGLMATIFFIFIIISLKIYSKTVIRDKAHLKIEIEPKEQQPQINLPSPDMINISVPSILQYLQNQPPMVQHPYNNHF